MDRVFLWITCMIALIGLCSPCYVNDCMCYKDRIICENVDQASPLFTITERFKAIELHLSGQQANWIKDSCALFPRLTLIVMIDDTACPAEHCVPCR